GLSFSSAPSYGRLRFFIVVHVTPLIPLLQIRGRYPDFLVLKRIFSFSAKKDKANTYRLVL
ncbi:MAG: hypothetical protein IJ589_00345, partial [Lachnospiraceae bacterium]|nr:hypothetical protein [Lachnospiraceae bacterium]